jgi:hypothetical protein
MQNFFTALVCNKRLASREIHQRDSENGENRSFSQLVKHIEVPKVIFTPGETRVKSLTELAKDCHVPLGKLEANLKTEIKRFAEELKMACSWGGEEYFPIIEKLYYAYRADHSQKNFPWLDKM